ncbi:MAG: glycosyltransferase family 39 protein [Bacteroidota bacterium]
MSPSLRLLYFLLLILSLLSLWFGVQELSRVPLGNFSGLAALGAGMLLLAWVMASSHKAGTNPIQNRAMPWLDPLAQALLDRPQLYAGVLIGVVAVILATKPSFQPWPILLIWTVGICLFLTGSADRSDHLSLRQAISRFVAWAKRSKWELLAILALTGLAFLCRSIFIDRIPYSVHGDEGEMGLQARAVLRGQIRDPFATTFLSHATLWFFIQALGLRVFGNSITGLRLLSALIGTLAIPALYIFARPLYGRVTAILAAILFTFFHFDIHFSRIGLNNIADPLMILVTLAAFFYGYRKQSLFSFALTGVLMGLAQYLYFGARLILIIVAVLTVFLLIQERRQLQKFLGLIAAMVVGFVLTLGPLLRFYIAHPDTYFARLVEHGLLQKGAVPDLQSNGQSLLTALVGHAYRTFSFYITTTDYGPFYNSGAPMLSHGMEILFLIGIVLALLKWRNIEYFTLLIWVAGTALFGGFLLFDPPQAQRYLIAAPAVCILMALALVQISLLLPQLTGLAPRIWQGLTAVIVLALVVWNMYFYFGIYTPRDPYAYTPVMTMAGNYLHTQSGRSYAYMLTNPITFLNYGTIKFLANDPPGVDINDPLTSVDSLVTPPPGLRPVFVLIPERLNELEIIKERYPTGRLQKHSLPNYPQNIYLYTYEPY